MKGLEYFEVECVEQAGAETYSQIADNILSDLNLNQSIGRLHIYIDPEIPLFLAVGVIKQMPGLVHIRDFASALGTETGVVLDIGTETYLSPMLSILWDRYGRDLITQPDRFTVNILVPGLNPREIEDMVVVDPSEGMFHDIIYALQWIAPEGFKVRRQSIGEGIFSYVASENTLDQEEIEALLKEKFARIGVNA
ncbi:methanogenesis marker 17 protein [Methanogenium sp. S4BF]|uniref:methanogenesis marker 17 protein n=1 Tax=Methanogenium sp. S4BF TaxID=1789226 RepID=UPI002417051C|nr:methanogenesis marker 17 protein [Methanogenium sp. S4BF]WFN34672.1 methanogenesis marker 17 protein [Methanogenium sp. S4BF]